jgi:S1-C subfamily serine protease
LRFLVAIVLGLVTLLASTSAFAAGDDGKCDEGTLEHVYQRSKPGVVRIERPDGGLGTGFLFFTPKHVLTAFHVVDLGRDLVVKFSNGKHQSAAVVAIDSEHDLALLELESAVPDLPVLPAHIDLEIGMRVMAVGNPYGDAGQAGTNMENLLNWSASQGIVSAYNVDMFQTDALLAPGNSGGPIFACDGGVVGVADLLLDNRIGFAVRIHRALALTAKVASRKQSRFVGTVSLRDGNIGIVAEGDAYDYLGIAFGGRVVAYDRLAMDVRLGALFALPKDQNDGVVSRNIFRGTAEVAFGYRALFFEYSFPTYATLSLGGAGMIDRGSQRTMQIQYDDPACPGPTTCVPKLGASSQAIRGGSVAPMASLHLTFSAFDVGYAYKLDVIHPNFSTQRIYVGLVF